MRQEKAKILAKMKGLREFLGPQYEREEQGGDPSVEERQEEVDELPDFTDEESEELVRLGATSQESTKTTERIFDNVSNSDEDEDVRRELLEINDDTLEKTRKVGENDPTTLSLRL